MQPQTDDDPHLSLRLEGFWETTHVVRERAVLGEELDVGTVDADGTGLALLDVLFPTQRGEAPVLGDDDLLATWELVLCATEGLDGGGTVGVTSSHREEDLADVDTGDSAVGLAESATHSGLQSIGTSARQHLVDADDVVWVSADTEVETFLSGSLDHVLVGANAGGLERLGAQLLIFVGDQVNTGGELVDVGTLAAQVEDSDLWVWHTTVETRLGVRLVLAVAVATSWTTCHCDDF